MNAHKGAGKPLIWINAGEVSGDMHGASLIRALREAGADYSFCGMGGAAMEEAGMRPDFESRELSLVGLTEVFSSLPRIVRLLARTYKLLKEYRPKALILLDSPDYNFFLARMAKRLGIPTYFYISPQVWAWRTGRVNFLREHSRKILCILPFEKDFYAGHGVDAEFVGHPLMDALDFEALDAVQPAKGHIGILPGSRSREISSLMPEFAEAARILAQSDRNLSFTVVRAPGVTEETIRSYWPGNLPLNIVGPEDRYSTMRSCQMLLAASGTVTLETALLGIPTIVAYKMSPLTFWVGKQVVKVDYVSLVNLILGREVFPELLQEEAGAENLAATASRWLGTPGILDIVRNDLRDLRARMGEPGAPEHAARIIMDDLKSLG